MSELHEALEWHQARQWLIVSGVIPPTHRVTKPDVDLVDFARSLRDGVFLCSLLNTMKPGCIPESEWNPRPLMQHTYLKNISAFLTACRTKFNIKETDQFSESDLYDVDNFQKVMHQLSLLSHTPEALSLGWVPFPRQETRHYYNEVPEEDIYASLKDIGMERIIYANMDELYAQVPQEEVDPYAYGNETIYDSICYYQAPPVISHDEDEKKKSVLHELYETEKSFLHVLKLVSSDFYSALCDHLTQEDVDLLFSTAKLLYPVHCSLLDGFEKSIKSNGSEITTSFMDVQQGLLHYGVYAARLPVAVERAKQLQKGGETCRVLQQCQERSNQRFPLSDLLSVPIQRFLKYPLLVKELHKCAKKGAQSEVDNLEAVMSVLEDIAGYINASRGDFEAMKQIEEVEQSLSSDYKGPSLLQCGRYHLDGELRMRSIDQQDATKTPRWAFLFDKVMLLCKKPIRLGFGARYSPKHVFIVSTLKVEPVTGISSKGGKFTYPFRLMVQGQGEFLAFAKTEELKSQWIDAINHAKEMSSPRDGKRGFHSFELKTFERPCYCDVCNKLLHGCYFQGYCCSTCHKASHRECLKTIERCTAGPPRIPLGHRRLGPTLSTGGLEEVRPPAPMVRGRSGRQSAAVLPSHDSTGKGYIYVAKQKYDAIGSRSNRVLSFDRGEELEVFNPSANSEWWEAISLRTGNRGEVPASYLTPKGLDEPISELEPSTSPGGRRRESDDKLRGFPWYLGKKSRIEAEQALNRMRDGVFLIRESDVRPGEYAIALKWNKMPKHIKICKHASTRKFFVSDVCEFMSVEDLVAYYQQNSLGSSFPGVDTTLRYPYRDMMDSSVNRPRSSSNMNPPPPPNNHPTLSVSSVAASEEWAEVLFNFAAEYPDELTIDRRDKVKIIKKDTNKIGWWLGECKGQTGLFPSNYVREIVNS